MCVHICGIKEESRGRTLSSHKNDVQSVADGVVGVSTLDCILHTLDIYHPQSKNL